MIKPRIGGHPVHIMLAHFPSALYPMAVVCSTLYYYNGNPIPGHVAFYAMAGGTAFACLAIIAGLWESWLVPLSKTKIIITIAWHATFNGIVTIIFIVWLVKAWQVYPTVIKDSTGIIIVKWILIAVLFAGNFFGGKLLLKYRLGSEEENQNH
jgi:uncharacterized membrane protein